MSIPSLSTALVTLSLEDPLISERVRDQYERLLRDAHRALDDGNVPRDGRREWIVPGRIEVLGKHVDYAGGRSLLCTAERGIALVARPRADATMVVRDARRREAVAVPFEEVPHGTVPWAVYPRTVVRRLRRNFGSAVRGCDVALASNLPSAAGVSSSSALTVGLTLVLSSLSGLPATPLWHETLPDRVALAGYVGALENGADFGALGGERGVGTMGGAQDQTAILCSAPGRLDVFRWAPVQHERSVPWPSEYTFAIGVSGVVAAKTGAAREQYNRVARTAHHLVRAWNESRGDMRDEFTRPAARTLSEAFQQAGEGSPMTDVPLVLLDAARASATDEFSADALEARLHQFFEETFHIVPGAASALADLDIDGFARLVARSQAGAERALGNQIPATVALVTLAREIGAVAASAFGAGFGGSVWAMVRKDESERFLARWRERYLRSRTGNSARTLFFSSDPSAPAFENVARG